MGIILSLINSFVSSVSVQSSSLYFQQLFRFSSKPRANRHFSVSSSLSMDSTISEEVVHDFSPFLLLYKDGHVERLIGNDIDPPGLDQNTQVQSKDIIYLQEENLSSRLYLPRNAVNSDKKLPLLVFYHGGAFCIETAFSPVFHKNLNNLVAEANIIAVSVEYRRAPEHPLPIGYEDSWTALKWVASHVNGNGPEEWLNSYADFGKVFLSGESAGANIAHHMGIRNGKEKLFGINLVGIALVHPYFWGKEPIGNEAKESEKRSLAEALWHLACPTTSGCDDPWINPLVDPDLGKLGCNKILVMVAEKDLLRDRGWHYYYKLKEIGWKGLVEIMESKEEDHVFHLQNPTTENALAVLKRMASFINENPA